MGTFLYERLENVHFNEQEKLKEILKKELLDFGEATLKTMQLFDKSFYLLDLGLEETPEGMTALAFNRREFDRWEPTYVDFNEPDFKGIRARGIGSKIGHSYHYEAMLICRVLCECFSEGSYTVYGDASYRELKVALVYIGKKYGYELVRKFIENRCDAEKFIQNGHMQDCWCVRGDALAVRYLLHEEDFDKWTDYVHDWKDLKKVEACESPEYSISCAFLAVSLLMHCLREDLRETEQSDEALLQLFTRYFSARFADLCSDQYLDSLPKNLTPYRGFYQKCGDGSIEGADFYFGNYSRHIDIIGRCLQLLRPDAAEQVSRVKERFRRECLPQLEQESENKEVFRAKLLIQDFLLELKPSTEQVEAILEEIRSVDRVGGNDWLWEFEKATDADGLSAEVIDKIRAVTTQEVFADFLAGWRYEDRTVKAVMEQLADIGVTMQEFDHLVMLEPFFYAMLEAAKQPEAQFRLDLLQYTLKSEKSPEEKRIINWIVENDGLYAAFLRPFYEAANG